MARRCIFCQQNGPTREHVFPAWLGDVLTGEGEFHFTREHLPVKDAPEIRDWSGNALNLTVRQVCGPCNNGWMSSMEARVKPLLTPLIAGEERTLSRDSMVALASWMTKTAMVGEFALPESPAIVIRQEWRDAFFVNQLPPFGTWVWLDHYHGGAIAPDELRAVWFGRHLMNMHGDGREFQAMSTVLSLGHVVFLVLIALVANAHETLRIQLPRPAIVLWPNPHDDAVWPPPVPGLTDAELRALSQIFVNR